MLTKLIRGATALALALTLAACSSATESTPGNANPTNSDASVHIGFVLEPTGLDMFSTSGAALRQVELGNVYEGLVRRTHDGAFEPLLAKEWKISDDGLNYQFTLQDDVTFTDGQKMTSADVVASLSLTCGEACGGTAETASTRLTAVTSIKADGDDKVVITLKQRDWRLIDTLSTDVGAIVPAKHDVDLAQKTNGTGPYQVTNWQQGSSITLTRRDDYWGTKPKNKEVVYHFYKDPSAAANALASGEIDLHTAPNADMIERFTGDDKFVIGEGSSASWMTLGFNNKNEVLSDVRVRRALRMAVDKDGLITALGIKAERVGSMTVPDDPWYTDLTSVDNNDKEQAKALLKEAGQQNLTLTLKVANTYDSKISEYLAAQYKEIGVTLNIEQMEFATWLEDVYQKKDYELTMVLHVDPWTLSYYGNPKYYWNYDNPGAQKVLNEAFTATEDRVAHDKLKQLSELVTKDAASDWLYAPRTVILANTSVSGFPTNRINSEFHVWDIEKSN
ncbi:ABC transporter substrate-binding protein [Tessaracoccus sp. SD287]|uniref:ABC transporter substrate-binding protein n=1 Tax=Tessaracoccus sp. SD287 TaxID=2782008 RepID=UPI001A964C6A|nr:ABC transporter substrate-binding protein [Tessaracoccus sp. SD287]MBO1030938.1 ABC transporter substrate-binding protein [Tessaracoccus sp. SD287]